MFAQWADFAKLSKPVIAAVDGFCLGGGCELAMMCDIMVCSDKAKFGQPEINLGVIPGAGGTQRLLRAIGKSRAMHMILTGEMMKAQEAYESGLVAKVFSSDDLVEEAVKIGQTIAGKGGISVMMAKEAVNAAEELSLQEGLRFERRLFHSLFATQDQKEVSNSTGMCLCDDSIVFCVLTFLFVLFVKGMAAFLEKREPVFTNK